MFQIFMVRAVGDQLLKERVDRTNLKPGDHIYSWRTLGFYAHHGIFVGDMEGMDNAVIHFTNGPLLAGTGVSSFLSVSSGPYRSHARCSIPPREGHGVIVSCLDCFLSGGILDRFEYNVNPFVFAMRRNGTCTLAAADPDEDVVRRAKDLLDNGFCSYNAVMNNCVDFAMYYKTRKKSGMLG